MGAFSTGYRNFAYIADSGHDGFKINKILFSHLQKLMVERVMDGLGVDVSLNLRLWPLARVCVVLLWPPAWYSYEARDILGNPGKSC